MNDWEWLHEMPGSYRVALVLVSFVVLWAACRYDEKRGSDLSDGLAFVFAGFAIAFTVWSCLFCLGAFVKPFNPSMDFMSGK